MCLFECVRFARQNKNMFAVAAWLWSSHSSRQSPQPPNRVWSDPEDPPKPCDACGSGRAHVLGTFPPPKYFGCIFEWVKIGCRVLAKTNRLVKSDLLSTIRLAHSFSFQLLSPAPSARRYVESLIALWCCWGWSVASGGRRLGRS